MSEWKTIDSAPRDGCGKGIFTGTRGPTVLLCAGGSIYIGFWNGTSWDDGDYHDHIEGVTHWMPLPDAPAQPDTDKE
jgi:hypothetical protein